MKKVTVAGISMSVKAENADFVGERFSAYVSPDLQPPVMEITSRLNEEIQLPEGKLLCQSKSGQVWQLSDGRLCRCETDKNTGKVTLCVKYTPDFLQVEIEFNPPYAQWVQDYEFVYIGTAFANRLETLGGSTLHGSSISYKGEGVVFSAPSGTGKSTHTALWKKCFGDDVEHINDDRPAIRIEGETPMIYGTPWSGKTALNNPLSVPLRAIVFIERGEQNAVTKMDFTESMLLLGGQIGKPYYDAGLGGKVVDLMVELTKRVPIYRLTCNMKDEAAFIARKAIFGE